MLDRAFREAGMGVLVYNVGAASLRAATAFGLRFERGSAPPAPPHPLDWSPLHYHRYEVVAAAAGPNHWGLGRCLASWSHVPIRTLAAGTAPIWLAVRGALAVHEPPTSPPARFAVRLSVAGQVSGAGATKVLFDGAISALHCQREGAADGVASCLAAALGLTVARVQHELQDRTKAILGARIVVRPFGTGVKWNPADEECASASLFARTRQQPRSPFRDGCWRSRAAEPAAHFWRAPRRPVVRRALGEGSGVTGRRRRHPGDTQLSRFD